MQYIIFFIVATTFSVLINGLFLKFSRTMGTKNNPGETEIRWGSTSKPAFGGISFYIVFLFKKVLTLLGKYPISRNFTRMNSLFNVIGFFAC